MEPTTTPAGPGLRPAVHLAAVGLLGWAIAAGSHGFSPAALACVGAALALLVAALFLPATGRGVAAARAVLIAGLASDFYHLPLIGLSLTHPQARATVQPFVWLAVLAAVLTVALVLRRPRGAVWACFPSLLVVRFLMGAWYLSLSPNPAVDVYQVQQLACETLLHGRNPYAMTFPNLYGSDTRFYPPGTVVHGRVQCGYVYPPLSLELDLPAYLLSDDVRLGYLTAFVLAAALLGYCVPRRAGVEPAVLLSFLPGSFLLLENAFVDPYVALLLAAAAVLTARRWWRAGAVAAGLMLAGKQYTPFAAPAVLMLVPQPWRPRPLARWAGLAFGAGCAVTLPFLVWNPAAFFRSLTLLESGVPRPDSTSFVTLLARLLGWHPTLAVPALCALPASALVVWRAPRTPAGFAAGAGLIYLAVFAFSTQAFGNYFYLVAAALCASVAVAGPLTARPGQRPPPRSASGRSA